VLRVASVNEGLLSESCELDVAGSVLQGGCYRMGVTGRVLQGGCYRAGVTGRVLQGGCYRVGVAGLGLLSGHWRVGVAKLQWRSRSQSGSCGKVFTQLARLAPFFDFHTKFHKNRTKIVKESGTISAGVVR